MPLVGSNPTPRIRSKIVFSLLKNCNRGLPNWKMERAQNPWINILRGFESYTLDLVIANILEIEEIQDIAKMQHKQT